MAQPPANILLFWLPALYKHSLNILFSTSTSQSSKLIHDSAPYEFNIRW